MELELSLQLVSMLFAVAALAGFIDAIAGGGGLITVPVLLSVGLSPTQALATNKLQSCGGSFSASWYFVRRGFVKIKDIKLALVCAFIGSALGTVMVQLVNADFLGTLLPFLILAIAGYFLFSPKVTDQDKHQVLGATSFAFTAALGIGFYDGFFGPGTGSFLAIAFVTLAGFGLAKATAHAKLLNFSTNFASLIFFALGGQILWSLGLIMLLGQVLGARFGSKMVVSKGSRIIRPLIVCVSTLMALKLLWHQFQPQIMTLLNI